MKNLNKIEEMVMSGKKELNWISSDLLSRFSIDIAIYDKDRVIFERRYNADSLSYMFDDIDDLKNFIEHYEED